MPSLWIMLILAAPIGAWLSSAEDRREPSLYRRQPRELRRVHYHTKRHMLPDPDPKKRSTTVHALVRNKPSGHLIPLKDDDMENDEMVSVAIGPPPIRPKFEKSRKINSSKKLATPPTSAVTLVKDMLTELTKEFLSKDVNENFVFGQFLGMSMKNLTTELRLNMQHEILDLIVKYQKMSRGDIKEAGDKNPQIIKVKDAKMERKTSANDTEEPWPDFSNLANIVA